MRKTLAIGALFVVFVVLSAQFQPANAAIETGSKVSIGRLYQNAGSAVPSDGYDTSGTWGGVGGGGEFLITDLGSDPVEDPFKTFCLEKNEYINLGGEYWVSLGSEAVNGGAGGPSPDPIGDATKWLYYWYVNSLLDDASLGTGFKYNDKDSADALQLAIWYLEEEITSSGLTSLASTLVNKANLAGDEGWNSDNGDVLVLNLWGNAGLTDAKQSQLYFQPPPVGGDDVVPEPMSVAIWTVLAAAGAVVYRRRN